MGHSEFGTRLRTAIKTAGKTQQDLADELGVSPQTVGGWISGRIYPRPRNMAAIVSALDVDRGWLVSGSMGLDEAAVLGELRQIRAIQGAILSAVEEVRRHQVDGQGD
jgi:transcriptional regulator with XRE-family HTH domain